MNSQFALSMRFQEEAYPDLLDISSLLYNLELSHDFGLILTEDEYKNYEFSRFFWYRNGRPIKESHRLKAAKISKESPLELTVIIASIGAIWALIQIIDKVSNWNLARKKLKLEVEKLELEIEEKKNKQIAQARKTLHYELKSRYNAVHTEQLLVKRLEESPIKLLSIEIKQINKSNPKDEG